MSVIKKATILFAALLALTPAALHAEEPLRLNDLLAESERQSPELAALKYRYEAARERVPQAGALDDPMLSLGFQSVPVDSFAFNRDSMTGKMFEVSQMVPFYGKRTLKAEAATHEARQMEAEYREKALMLHAEIKKVYYELYAVKKGMEIIGKNLSLMDAFRKTAEARYSVGKGILRDVVKAQVEVSMLLDKRLGLEKDERTKRAYLGSLAGRETPVTGYVEDLAPTKADMKREDLTGAAISKRPAIAASDEKVRKGKTMLDLANKDYYPDFTFSLSYMQKDRLDTGMDQPDMLSAMVSINLPIWRHAKLDPGVRAAAAERAMADRERDAVVKEIYYKVDSLVSEVEQDDRILKLYKEGVIPQATQDLDSALAGYEVGRADFLDLLESRRTLFDYELGYYNTLAEREKAVADLEATTGVEFK